MKKPYHPISCDFYDELEAIATLKQVCNITFWQEQGVRQTVKSRITTLFTRNKEEFLEMDNGMIIRLDQIIKVGDKELQSYC